MAPAAQERTSPIRSRADHTTHAAASKLSATAAEFSGGVGGKHLASYVLWMQVHGKSASTIKADLAAIRFFHDKMSHPKYPLPSNEELAVKLERRSFGGVDRTWSNIEFNKMLGKDRYDFILALYLGRYAGLRIHECFRIDTATAERVLRENTITLKGKGGKVRTVPINE